MLCKLPRLRAGSEILHKEHRCCKTRRRQDVTCLRSAVHELGSIAGKGGFETAAAALLGPDPG